MRPGEKHGDTGQLDGCGSLGILFVSSVPNTMWVCGITQRREGGRVFPVLLFSLCDSKVMIKTFSHLLFVRAEV